MTKFILNDTAVKNKERINLQKKLYETILEFQNQTVIIPHLHDKASIFMQFMLKVVCMVLVIFEQFEIQFFDQQYALQLIMVVICVQFWITKNFIGKRLLGLWWFFAEDENGRDRLTFECRANGQLIGLTQPRLFWLIQSLYVFIAGLLFVEDFMIIPNSVRFQSKQAILKFFVFLSGFTNGLFFYLGSKACEKAQITLQRTIGTQYVKKLETASMILRY